MQQPEEPRENEQESEHESLAALMERHRALEQSLQLLASRRTLTPAEQREVAQLKKHKLLTKDRIARMSGGGGSVEQ
jgi:uncharacterized protein YdcH (DUF465 family)